MKIVKILFLLFVLVMLNSCEDNSSGSNSNNSEIRSFFMGFTTWPYATSIAAANDLYLSSCGFLEDSEKRPEFG